MFEAEFPKTNTTWRLFFLQQAASNVINSLLNWRHDNQCRCAEMYHGKKVCSFVFQDLPRHFKSCSVGLRFLRHWSLRSHKTMRVFSCLFPLQSRSLLIWFEGPSELNNLVQSWLWQWITDACMTVNPFMLDEKKHDIHLAIMSRSWQRPRQAHPVEEWVVSLWSRIFGNPREHIISFFCC